MRNGLVLKTGLYSIGSRFSYQLIQFLSMPLIINRFGLEVFGFIATLATLNIAATMFNFGLTKKLQNEMSAGKEDLSVRINSTIVIVLIMALSMFVLLITGTFVWFEYNNELFVGQKGIVLVFAFNISLLLVLSFYSDILKGKLKSDFVEKVGLGSNFFVALFVFISLVLDVNVVFVYAACYTVGPLLSFLIFVSSPTITKLRIRLSFDKHSIKSCFDRVAISFFLLTFVQFFSFSSDTLIVAKFMSLEDASVYNIGFKVYSVLIFIFSAFSAALWPVVRNQVYNNKNIKFYRYEIVTFLYCFGGFVGITVSGAWFVRDVMSIAIDFPSYFFTLFAIQFVLVVITSFLIPMLNAFEILSKQIYFGFISLFANLVLSVVLINYFGIIGTIMATIIAHLIFGVIPFAFLYFTSVRKQCNLNLK